MMEDEQTNETELSATQVNAQLLAPSYYGSFEQNARSQALGIAHDREASPADVVARAEAYATFIVG